MVDGVRGRMHNRELILVGVISGLYTLNKRSRNQRGLVALTSGAWCGVVVCAWHVIRDPSWCHDPFGSHVAG